MMSWIAAEDISSDAPEHISPSVTAHVLSPVVASYFPPCSNAQKFIKEYTMCDS